MPLKSSLVFVKQITPRLPGYRSASSILPANKTCACHSHDFKAVKWRGTSVLVATHAPYALLLGGLLWYEANNPVTTESEIAKSAKSGRSKEEGARKTEDFTANLCDSMSFRWADWSPPSEPELKRNTFVQLSPTIENEVESRRMSNMKRTISNRKLIPTTATQEDVSHAPVDSKSTNSNTKPPPGIVAANKGQRSGARRGNATHCDDKETSKDSLVKPPSRPHDTHAPSQSCKGCDQCYNDGYQQGHKEGRKEGTEEGRVYGKKQAEKQQYSEALQKGGQAGFDVGYQAAWSAPPPTQSENTEGYRLVPGRRRPRKDKKDAMKKKDD